MRRGYLAVLLVGALPATLRAQDPAREAECASVLQRLFAITAAARSQCQQLATKLVTDQVEAWDARVIKGSIPPGVLQPKGEGEAQPAGSPAQTEAVPTVQPTGLASASVAVAGSQAGTDAITSVSLNPAILFGGSDQERVAKWSRFSDVTLFFPITDAGNNAAGALDYFGVRLRVNMTGLTVGDELLKDAVAAFRDALGAEGKLIGRLTPVLQATTSVERCALAIQQSGFGERAGDCDSDFVIELSPTVHERLRDRLAAARKKADSRYLGLDLRLDTGDPTLGAVPGSDVTALQAGVAFGRRFLRNDIHTTTIGVRSRLGARYIEPALPGADVTWALDGGFGFEAGRLLETDQDLRLTGGLEFRYSNSSEAERAALQTDFLTFRMSLNLPLAGGAGLAVGLSAPVAGDVDPSLTFNVNWGVLLPGLTQAVRAPAR